jgi:hypothetical protein
VNPVEQIVLVMHGGGAGSHTNVVKALHQARLKQQAFDLAAGASWPKLERFSCVVLLADTHHQYSGQQQRQLSDYVAAGGGLVVILTAWSGSLATLVGAKESSRPSLEGIRQPMDMSFSAELLPGLKGITITEEMCVSELELLPGSETLVQSSGGLPIAWRHRIGRGRILVWNTDFVERKISQGLIVASVMNVQPVTVRPIANTGIVQIDDFPCAAAPVKFPPVADEYGLTLLEFYDRVWLPDMLELAERYDIAYTFLTLFNYNGRNEPPFDFDEWSIRQEGARSGAEPFAVYAARVASQQHELGLHGYNHCPLRLSIWGSKTNMVLAMQAAKERWQRDRLGPLPRTYVPPNNTYDAAGLEAVTETFPSVQVVAGFIEGDFEKGRDRDLGPEPWNPEVLCIPRVTSGYRLTPQAKFRMIAQLGLLGAWAHFLHPDDIIDTPERRPTAQRTRNHDNSPWRGHESSRQRGLYYRFTDWLDDVGRYYPWLRFTRTEDAGPILRSHLTNSVRTYFASDEVTIDSETVTFFQVCVSGDRKIDPKTLSGAAIIDERQLSDQTLYTLQGQQKLIRVGLFPI